MQLVNILPLFGLVGAVLAGPVELVSTSDHAAKLEARGGSATGCVQAHCTMIEETALTSKSINYEIYWNGNYLFHLAGKPGSNTVWNGVKDYKGRQWGFKSVGNCDTLSYINDFQSNYDYYTLTRTSRDSSKHDCPPYTQKGNKEQASHCIDYEAIFSDGNSGYCYGYTGLKTCDFRATCR